VFAFRNVEQLEVHLACPTEGAGKLHTCREVKTKAPVVQLKYAAIVAEREVARTKKQKEANIRSMTAEAKADLKRKACSGGGGAQRSVAASFAL